MRRILLLYLLFAAPLATAQQRFEQVERRNPWNGSNAAGLRQDSLGISYAAVYFTKENGGMASHSTSDDSWNAGAKTSSIRHFDNLSFAGSFAYDYFDGRYMSGSMFTVPDYYPFDMLEFTPGRKIRESYAFAGSVSAVLADRWTGGLKVDFEARNYAKRKDLRHKNTRLDFEFSPGVMYRAEAFAAGVNYIFAKNSEKLEAEEVGSSPESYQAFLDKGLYYGALRLWDNADLHLATSSGVSGFPVKEISQGAGLQLQYGGFYADVAYRNRRGETGERGVVWYEFETSQIMANAVYFWQAARADHFLRAQLDWRKQENKENSVTFNTQNGVSLPHIEGSNRIFCRKSIDLKVEYELVTRHTRTVAGVTATGLDRESTLMYPYVKAEKRHWAGMYADCIVTLGFWELNFGADYRQGGLSERARQFETSATPGDYPERLTAYHDYENEYLTAKRLGTALGLRRNIKQFYIDLYTRYEHGFDLKYVAQSNRVAATISVGYNF